jgi:DNA-binding transcriptional regulator YdaS (Cro superfamily)
MDNTDTPVSLAIQALGGPSKAAAALGISNPSVVLNWRKRGQVPADRVVDLAKLSGIPAATLRPDIFKAAS